MSMTEECCCKEADVAPTQHLTEPNHIREKLHQGQSCGMLLQRSRCCSSLSISQNQFRLICCCCGLIDVRLYSAILHSLEHTHCACMWLYISDQLYSTFCFLNTHQSGVLMALAWLVLHETAAVLVQVLCTSYNHTPCHFMQSHIYIHKVYACLAVTCHFHIWQNDRDLLHATAVTQGWNGYQNNRIIVSTES